MSDIIPQKKENIWILVVSLTVISAVAAGILACADYVTRAPRLAAELRETNSALKALQPALNNEPDAGKIYAVTDDRSGDLQTAKWTLLPQGKAPENDAYSVLFYPAKKDGKLISVLAKATSPKGYGGNMTIMACLKPDGTIENVIVTANNETPGLGTVVTDRTRQLTAWGLLKGEKADPNSLPPNSVLDFFSGKRFAADNAASTAPDDVPSAKWEVKKDGGAFLFVTGATVSSRAVTYGVRKIVSCYAAVKNALPADFAATAAAKR